MNLTKEFTEVGHRMFPNVSTNQRWVLTLSNIPTIHNNDDLKYFDSYIRSVDVPEYSITNIAYEGMFGYQTNHPGGGVKENTNLGSLTVEYKISEDYFNWLMMIRWIKDLRNGDVDRSVYEMFRKYVCRAGLLQLLDNHNRPVALLTFTNMFPLAVSGLSLMYGTADELSFKVTFQYETFDYDLYDVSVGGGNPTAPETVSPCTVTPQPLIPDAVWGQ